MKHQMNQWQKGVKTKIKNIIFKYLSFSEDVKNIYVALIERLNSSVLIPGLIERANKTEKKS